VPPGITIFIKLISAINQLVARILVNQFSYRSFDQEKRQPERASEAKHAADCKTVWLIADNWRAGVKTAVHPGYNAQVIKSHKDADSANNLAARRPGGS
jgi:hypothetical protein